MVGKSHRADHEVVVIGSGFSGLCMGVQLKQARIDDFVILERERGFGGTWRANTYPGCACDVPGVLYSFSFAHNVDGSRRLPTQSELLAYTERVARDFGLVPHLRVDTALLRALYDEPAGLWRLHTSRGELSARSLVIGSGVLSRPAIPELPGVRGFLGKVFHSAQWDHGHDLRGKRVAVIGTGASAVQFVPHVAAQAAQLDLYQRTPGWVLPRLDRQVGGLERWLLRRFAPLRGLCRATIWARHEARALGFVYLPGLARLAQRQALAHLHRQIPDDAALRDRLAPDHRLGCKRVLLADDYYPALTRANVELVSGGIREVRAHGIVASDGRERPVDTLIFATGFEAQSAFSAIDIRGLGGQRLGGALGGSVEAYKGATVAGFPNLFMIAGPNTGLGHGSMIHMIESGVTYALDAIKTLRRHQLRSIEVRPAAQRDYNARLQRRLARTVWGTGCSSWYLDRDGRNRTLWPGIGLGYRWATRRLDLQHYDVRGPGPNPVPCSVGASA